MGKLTPTYKKAIIDDLRDNVLSEKSSYYAFVSNPNAIVAESIPPIINNDYNINFLNDWQMIFGKKLKYDNFSPVIKRVIWKSGEYYNRYDNTIVDLYEKGNYYVYSQRVYQGKDFGGGYYVYKCIDNNYDPITKRGGPSTVDPGSINDPTQKITFETSDGYKWRYITTVSNKNMYRFSTGDLDLSNGLSPINIDQDLVTTAKKYCGVDVMNIEYGGSGYDSYNSGTIQSVSNSTVFEIAEDASGETGFYVNNSIYFFNTTSATGQLFKIVDYFTQAQNKFVIIDRAADLTNITPQSTQYIISPQIITESDGVPPKAYSVINSVSNSISKIVIIDPGSDISWANVSVYSYPSLPNIIEANVYAIVPPPGGHGADPEVELGVVGFGVNFQFSNNESKQIPANNISYDKIGIIKNPYALVKSNASKGIKYTANTFNQILLCNVNQTAVTGQTVIGQTSKSRATVVLANSSKISLIGDQTFLDGENIAYSNGVIISQIGVDKRADVYAKDMYPMYVQNINKVTRSDTQTEEFKLVVQL